VTEKITGIRNEWEEERKQRKSERMWSNRKRKWERGMKREREEGAGGGERGGLGGCKLEN